MCLIWTDGTVYRQKLLKSGIHGSQIALSLVPGKEKGTVFVNKAIESRATGATTVPEQKRVFSGVPL